MPGAEILLVAALLALYLQDSALLLHFDEVLVERDGRGWRVLTAPGLEARGRFLSVPNPLLPMRTRLRAGWLHADGRPADTPQRLARFERLLWPVRLGCTLTGVVLLGVVPWLLLDYRDPVALVAALAVAWLLILGMLACVARLRAHLPLSPRALAGLALEALLCPPHAINLYRRLCAMRGFRGDPIRFAASQLPTDARRRLQTSIEARLDLFALADDAPSQRSRQLAAARARASALLR